MAIHWNNNIIDLSRLLQVSRGDQMRIQKYLNQFQELIPTRKALLSDYVLQEDRNMVRQTVHQMSPQLHFFGVRGVNQIITHIETSFLEMPMAELKLTVDELITQMNLAKAEIDRIMDEQF